VPPTEQLRPLVLAIELDQVLAKMLALAAAPSWIAQLLRTTVLAFAVAPALESVGTLNPYR
jgi:hypothetical protein